MKLPVLSARDAETTLCTYCPKLCRPACPVSTVEGRETVTPWGKMRAMGELIRGVAAPDASHVAPAYACTGCMRCLRWCELNNPVADTLRDGRVEALGLGTAPEEVLRLVSTFSAREAALVRAAAHLPTGVASTAYFPGCSSVVFEQKELLAIASALRRLDGPCALVAERCCGLPLLEAGDRAGFLERAANMAQRLGAFERVVVGDAGCAHALRVIYPRMGVALPPVVHLVEAADAAAAEIPRLAGGTGAWAYHDACRLGRGLGVYDAPRNVLSRLLGRPALELPARRDRAPCSGAGGLLTKTRPATAVAIAKDLGALMTEIGAEALVTTCASSRRLLARAGIPAMDLGVLLARAVSRSEPGLLD